MYLRNLINKIKRQKYKHNLHSNKKKSKWDNFFFIKIKNIFLIFILIFIIVSIGYLGQSVLSLDFKRDSSDSRELMDINDNPRITILLIGLDKTDEYTSFIDALSVLTYDKNSKKIGIFAINPDIDVYSSKYETNVHLRTIYSNPKADDNEIPFTIDVVESLFALRIDRYIVMDIEGFQAIFSQMDSFPQKIQKDINGANLSKFDTLNKEIKAGSSVVSTDAFMSMVAADNNGMNIKLNNQSLFISGILRNLFSFNNIINSTKILDVIDSQLYTDLSTKEVIKLIFEFRSIHQNQVKIAYTRSSSLIKQEKIFGIYSRYTPILDGLDSDLSTILLNSVILKEQAGIEVLNGSGIKGLANARSRWIKNAGGRIVHVGNSIDFSEVTYIYVIEADKYPNTIVELNKIFNGKAVILHEEYKYKHFGDIVVVIGSEYE